jgi:hypothetical protein
MSDGERVTYLLANATLDIRNGQQTYTYNNVEATVGQDNGKKFFLLNGTLVEEVTSYTISYVKSGKITIQDDMETKDRSFMAQFDKKRSKSIQLINSQTNNYAYYSLVVYRRGAYNEATQTYKWDLISSWDSPYQEVLVASYQETEFLKMTPIAYGYPVNYNFTEPNGGLNGLFYLGRRFIPPQQSINLLFGVLDTEAQVTDAN